VGCAPAGNGRAKLGRRLGGRRIQRRSPFQARVSAAPGLAGIWLVCWRAALGEVGIADVIVLFLRCLPWRALAGPLAGPSTASESSSVSDVSVLQGKLVLRWG
jgi:hypothetical protein